MRNAENYDTASGLRQDPEYVKIVTDQVTTSTLLRTVGCNEVGRGDTIHPVPLTPSEIAARIRRAREARKPEAWSQFDLAIALGVSPSTIYRWEKGKLPSVSELLRLEEVLGTPAGYLTAPPEQQAELADLRSGLDALGLRLQRLEEMHEQSREAVLEILASIHDQLVQMQASQAQRDAQAT